MKRAVLISFAVPAIAFAMACGATASGPGATGDGGVADSAVDGSTSDGPSDGGTDLFPSDTTKIVVAEKGGLPFPAVDGSTCAPIDSTFTLLLPTRELSWTVCTTTDGGSFALRTGETTIAAADFVALSNALHSLRRATNKPHCDEDKPVETIVFTTPAGDTTYQDDFYFCSATDPKLYVTGLDAVLADIKKLLK
jgi:hypothetical protein